MKIKYSYIFIVISSIIILFNCKDDPTQPQISEPFEVTIASDTTNVGGSSIVKFVAVVLNNKNNTIEYKWSADKGEFLSSVTDSTINWKAPSLSNSCEIELRAIDGVDTITATLIIEVDGFRAEIESSVHGSTDAYSEINLKCNVFNPPSENLTYKWNTVGGHFLSDSTASSIVWKAPGINRKCNIGAIVTNGVDTLVSNFSIDVNGFSVSVSPSIWSVSGYGEKQLQAYVSNAPSTGLTYSWASDKGEFLTSITDPIITWKAPNETRTCKIKVSVTDGIDTASATANIGVTLVEIHELIFGLYDDFDGLGCEQTYNGSQLAVEGGLSSALWRPDPRGNANIVHLSSIGNFSFANGSTPSGNVLKMEHQRRGDNRTELIYPEDIDFVDYFSWSADIMLSSESTHDRFGCKIDYHTSIPEQPPGISWYCQAGLGTDPDNDLVRASVRISNKNTGYVFSTTMMETEMDIWHNIEMKIVKLNDTQIEILFYVDGELKASEIPEDSEILLSPSRLAFGPKRSLQVWTGEYNPGTMITYIDNIYATYKNRIE